MSPDDTERLTREYRQKLLALFARVDARQPEKGIDALLQRARELAGQEGQSYEKALEQVYRGAVERTERRLALLGVCKRPDSD